MSKLQLILFLLLAVHRLPAQNVEDTIRQIAIDCTGLTAPNNKLYQALKDYKFICVGEMHGTNEPARFLVYLARLFSDHKKKVVVGFEIHSDDMVKFLERPDSVGLSQTTFFSSKGGDGRNSEAWFNAINSCNELKLPCCFFQETTDMLMYHNILECYAAVADTNCIVLTLSGNVHNKLLPYKGSNTMGWYLKERFGHKVFTINHIYNEGTMNNLSPDSLRVRDVPPINNAFATATTYSRYFIPNIFRADGYSAYFYTDFVTASFPLRK